MRLFPQIPYQRAVNAPKQGFRAFLFHNPVAAVGRIKKSNKNNCLAAWIDCLMGGQITN